MNCSYHSHVNAVVSCNGCGRPLCSACDHRVKGFPFCQDCIVEGVELLRNHNRSNYAPYVKNRTSPWVAAALSAICPGIGAAYNGQMLKGVVHFAVFVGLFQFAAITGGMPLFVFGFLAMWLFALVDAWRTANMIRSGVTPDVAEDILVRQFSGNPKLWGIVLAVLGAGFILSRVFEIGRAMRILVPVALLVLGIYILRGYVFKPKTAQPAADPGVPDFAASDQAYARYERDPEYSATQFGAWRDR